MAGVKPVRSEVSSGYRKQQPGNKLEKLHFVARWNRCCPCRVREEKQHENDDEARRAYGTRQGLTMPPSSTVRHAAYWASTGFAVLALGATGAADLLRVPAIVESLAHLGYPPYFATILGMWELLGAAASSSRGGYDRRAGRCLGDRLPARASGMRSDNPWTNRQRHFRRANANWPRPTASRISAKSLADSARSLIAAHTEDSWR
jgi:hypothetical protein